MKRGGGDHRFEVSQEGKTSGENARRGQGKGVGRGGNGERLVKRGQSPKCWSSTPRFEREGSGGRSVEGEKARAALTGGDRRFARKRGCQLQYNRKWRDRGKL